MTTQAPIVETNAPAHLKYFRPQVLDGTPLQEASYRLRYQVYCHEQKFLDPCNYPDGLETDEFDRCAIHVGAVDRHGELAGTARVVLPGPIGYPVFQHCAPFSPDELPNSLETVVEVSRMVVSRNYRRRPYDAPAGFSISPAGEPVTVPQRRGVDGEIFLTVMKAAYHVSKRIGATHWLGATERPLHRILKRRGFPFRQIGPESDYFGMVAPYCMSLEEFDRIIGSGVFPVLMDFAVGLDRPLSQTGEEGRYDVPVAV